MSADMWVFHPNEFSQLTCSLNWYGDECCDVNVRGCTFQYRVKQVKVYVSPSDSGGSGSPEGPFTIKSLRVAKQYLEESQDNIKQKVHVQHKSRDHGDCAFHLHKPVTIEEVSNVTSIHFQYALFPEVTSDLELSFLKFKGDVQAELVFDDHGEALVRVVDKFGMHQEHQIFGYYMTQMPRDGVVSLPDAQGPREDALRLHLLQALPHVTSRIVYGKELHFYFEKIDLDRGDFPAGISLFGKANITGFHIMYTDQPDDERPVDLYVRDLEKIVVTQQHFDNLIKNLDELCYQMDPLQFPYDTKYSYTVNVWFTLQLSYLEGSKIIRAYGTMPLSLACAYDEKFKYDQVVLFFEQDFVDHRKEVHENYNRSLQAHSLKQAKLQNDGGLNNSDDQGMRLVRLKDEDIIIEFESCMNTLEELRWFTRGIEWVLNEWTK